MIFGLVHVSYSLPEWQAVKLTFFAPWIKKTVLILELRTLLHGEYLFCLQTVTIVWKVFPRNGWSPLQEVDIHKSTLIGRANEKLLIFFVIAHHGHNLAT